ncbi:MAG TPA: YncE family protein [Rhodocyclaceae bacterium]|nr:YncE family protein [Rhodocyclaceae bacterium]
MRPIHAVLTSLVLAAMFVPATTLAQDYKAVSTLQGAGPAQALAVDTQARRLYAGRQGGVDVFDIDSGSKTGSVAVDGNVGGLALAPDLRRGYATSTDRSSVVIFDLDALTIVSTVPSGGKQPRELEYDPRAGVVYVSNAGDGRLAVIDAKSGEPKGSLALGGRLRQASADGRGNLFVADEARDVLHVVDTASLTSLGEISVWPGKAPTALVNDVKERRIYVATGNSKMVVVDPDPGQMLSVVDTGGTGAAGIAIQYAPARLVRLFMPNADGTMDVVQNAKLTATLESSVPKAAGGTAAAFDEKTGHAFIAGPNGIQVIGK